MPAHEAINPDQISYRITRGLGRARNEIKTSVLAHHPEHGVVGLLNITNEQWSSGRRGEPPPTQAKSGGKGLNVSLVHVNPAFQRQGIGSAMYNIAHREMGYAPGHDVVRTPAGNRFAQSVSGGEGGRGHIPGGKKAPYSMPQWGTSPDEPGDMATLQAKNWAAGTDIDPTWARALTPQKSKPNRRRKPKQMMLPGTESY